MLIGPGCRGIIGSQRGFVDGDDTFDGKFVASVLDGAFVGTRVGLIEGTDVLRTGPGRRGRVG